MQAGFTYFDTSYVYHGGASEAAFRETVVKRYPRGAFTITDKMPMFQIEREDQLWPIFSETLQHLGVDYLDYYWLHSLDKRHLQAFGRAATPSGLCSSGWPRAACATSAFRSTTRPTCWRKF